MTNYFTEKHTDEIKELLKSPRGVAKILELARDGDECAEYYIYDYIFPKSLFMEELYNNYNDKFDFDRAESNIFDLIPSIHSALVSLEVLYVPDLENIENIIDGLSNYLLNGSKIDIFLLAMFYSICTNDTDYIDVLRGLIVEGHKLSQYYIVRQQIIRRTSAAYRGLDDLEYLAKNEYYPATTMLLTIYERGRYGIAANVRKFNYYCSLSYDSMYLFQFVNGYDEEYYKLQIRYNELFALNHSITLDENGNIDWSKYVDYIYELYINTNYYERFKKNFGVLYGIKDVVENFKRMKTIVAYKNGEFPVMTYRCDSFLGNDYGVIFANLGIHIKNKMSASSFIDYKNIKNYMPSNYVEDDKIIKLNNIKINMPNCDGDEKLLLCRLINRVIYDVNKI